MFKEVHSPEDYIEQFEVEEILRPLETFGESVPVSDSDNKWVKKKRKDGSYSIFQKNAEGKRDGKFYSFYPNGNLWRSTEFQNGFKNGVIKQYTEDGQLSAEVSYHKGLREGVAKIYGTDGATFLTYKDGKRNGVTTWYRQDGSKRSEQNFEDDKPVGLCRIYDTDGKTIKKEEPYNGTVMIRGLNGDIEKKIKYVNGVPESREKGKVGAILKELSEQNPSEQNWTMVGEGKTEILAPSADEFRKNRQAKREGLSDAVEGQRESKGIQIDEGQSNVKPPQRPSKINRPPEYEKDNSQEFRVDFDFKSNRGVTRGDNGIWNVDFSTPVEKNTVAEQQDNIQFKSEKRKISYIKKSIINLKGGSR